MRLIYQRNLRNNWSTKACIYKFGNNRAVCNRGIYKCRCVYVASTLGTWLCTIATTTWIVLTSTNWFLCIPVLKWLQSKIWKTRRLSFYGHCIWTQVAWMYSFCTRLRQKGRFVSSHTKSCRTPCSLYERHYVQKKKTQSSEMTPKMVCFRCSSDQDVIQVVPPETLQHT